MGNIQHVGLKLDKAHRACCVGGNDVDGSTRLEGGHSELAHDRRVSACMTSFKRFKRDVLEAAAYSAMASDLVGFRLEFEVIGRPSSLGWTLPGMAFVKVRQIFANDEAPPRITSVRGFYALHLLLKDLWANETLAKELERKASCRSDGQGAGRALPARDGGEAPGSPVGDKAAQAKAAADPTDDEEGCGESAYLEAEDAECPICMDNIVQVVPACGHGLCQQCFRDWMAKSSCCPTCRVEGSNSEAWVVADQPTVPESQAQIAQLTQTVHAFLISLPRLETQWERAQRQSREKALRMRARSESLRSLAGQVDSGRSGRFGVMLRSVRSDVAGGLVPGDAVDGALSDYLVAAVPAAGRARGRGRAAAVRGDELGEELLDDQERRQLEYALTLSLSVR